jgi:fumarate reductase subunit D
MSGSGRSKEPLVWALFSGGGMLAALLLPAAFFVLFLAAPLGLALEPSREALTRVVLHPAVRLGLFVLVALSLAHWAHRFRYTLYDGLQLYHLNALIALFTYGAAAVLTIAAAVVLW